MTARSIDGFAFLTTSDPGFPPDRRNFVVMYAPSRVQLSPGELVKIAPDYARHEGHDGVLYTVKVTTLYPVHVERERRIADIVVSPERPSDYQFAACEPVAVEADDRFRRHGYRTWI